jgi:hypothetical protein
MHLETAGAASWGCTGAVNADYGAEIAARISLK